MLDNTSRRPMWQKVAIGLFIFVLIGGVFSSLSNDNSKVHESQNETTSVAENKIPMPSEEFLNGRRLEISVAKVENGTPYVDESKAVDAYMKGYKEKNCPYCMAALANYYVQGRGGLTKDVARGIALAEQSSNADCPYGSYVLGTFYFKGLGEDKTPNIEEWEKYMLRTITLSAHRDANKILNLYAAMANTDLAAYYDKKNYKEQAITHYELTIASYETVLKFLNKDNDEKEYNSSDKLIARQKILIPIVVEQIKKQIVNVESRPDYVFNNLRPLCMEFADNPIAAGNKYESKSLRITGQIEEINRDMAGNIYVRFMAPNVIGFTTVCCYFGDEQAVEPLRRFQYATIQGIYTDIRANTIILGGCSVINYTR